MSKTSKRNDAEGERGERQTPDAWIAAAREALINGGVARVKVEPLAAALGVTTGSFYWHFKDRQALLKALLRDWESTNSAAFVDALNGSSRDPAKQLEALNRVWIDEDGYSPRWDSAVRDWARTDPAVEAAVRRVDQRRIELLHDVFRELGYEEPEALVRARVTYFHQVGYYALQIVETRQQRLKLLQTYLDVLRGPRGGR